MNDENMRILNMIMFYVVAPIVVIEFFLIDFGIIAFLGTIHLITLAVFVILIVINSVYKSKHPKFEFKVNEIYEKAIFIIILVEFVFIQWK